MKFQYSDDPRVDMKGWIWLHVLKGSEFLSRILISCGVLKRVTVATAGGLVHKIAYRINKHIKNPLQWQLWIISYFLLQSGMVNCNISDEKGTHNILQRSLSTDIVSRTIHSYKLFQKSVKRICYFSWQLGVAVTLDINILGTPTSNLGWVTNFPDWCFSCLSTLSPAGVEKE